MLTRNANMGTGQGRGVWPVLGILLAAALVPTACVLWFMNAAMRNERLAVRQKLTDVYRQKVQTDQNEIAAFWSSRTRLPADRQPAELFAAIVRSGLADSAVIRDPQDRLLYPDSPSPQSEGGPVQSQSAQATTTRSVETGPLWEQAQDLEYAQSNPAQAASLYQQIAQTRAAPPPTRSSSEAARALLAQARCLAKAGNKDQAVRLLIAQFGRPKSYEDPRRNAKDPQGRLMKPNAQLLALELLGNPDLPQFRELAKNLWDDVTDYDRIVLSRPGTGNGGGRLDVKVQAAQLPGSQRRFLMLRLMELDPSCPPMFSRQAEEMADEYLQSSQPPAERLRVTPTALPGLWQMASEDGRMVLLFKEAALISDLKAACKLEEPFAGITTQLALPGRRDPGREPFLAVPASPLFPGWELAVYLNEDPFAVSAKKAESAYLAAGVSAIAVIALLAVAMASYLGRQIKLTRLKNDLIATVSHELKTPLASMRVLVDTLREGRCADSRQASEYFELIAKENERLSRLIDNFLTFSRMERNKRAFEFAPVDVADAVRTAVAAVHERFVSPQSRLTVELPAGLPPVRADRDAMITVVLNLLDNACKYSGDSKAVTVRAFASGGSVFIEVSDNGVGMSRRVLRRIFDKFYQVDQTLSRKGGGCGLGLSIVKFILDAHGGTIDVKSQPGKGSTFTIRLPAVSVLSHSDDGSSRPINGRQGHR